jgi:hypothetical protein
VLTALVGALFDSLRHEVPPDAANFTANRHDGGMLFTITPTRSTAAPIAIYAQDEDPVAYMTPGHASVFEIPMEGHWGYTVATIVVDGEEKRSTWRRAIAGFALGTEKREFDYEPYA